MVEEVEDAGRIVDVSAAATVGPRRQSGPAPLFDSISEGRPEMEPVELATLARRGATCRRRRGCPHPQPLHEIVRFCTGHWSAASRL